MKTAECSDLLPLDTWFFRCHEKQNKTQTKKIIKQAKQTKEISKVGLPAKTANHIEFILVFKIEKKTELSFGVTGFCWPTNQPKEWYDDKSLV